MAVQEPLDPRAPAVCLGGTAGLEPRELQDSPVMTVWTATTAGQEPQDRTDEREQQGVTGLQELKVRAVDEKRKM